MSGRRTSPWVAQLVFFALCSPVALVLGVVLLPWIVPVLLAFFGTLWCFWMFARIFTNTFVRVVDPKAHEAMKQQGIDPFTNSLGMPLNFDSKETRLHGLAANSVCPVCVTPVFVEANKETTCPSCGCCFHDNHWWRWNGNRWTLVDSR